MQYDIHHITRFKYDKPVRESVTELRMFPRSEGPQRCLDFNLVVDPHVSTDFYIDHQANTVHHFDIPAFHKELTLKATSIVEIREDTGKPDAASVTWADLDAVQSGDFWDYINPSRFARPTEKLRALADKHNLGRQENPLATLERLSGVIYNEFEYAPQTTHVESDIDEALTARRGVCQDFTHIMIALGRMAGIPCRYVSGYLFHRTEDGDRSAEDATHAWAEAWLPGLGWVGFDPTNHLLATNRHIRVAVGRDYADVPPTRGTFRGNAKEMLSVGVRVALSKAAEDVGDIPLSKMARVSRKDPNRLAYARQQQSQQQQ